MENSDLLSEVSIGTIVSDANAQVTSTNSLQGNTAETNTNNVPLSQTKTEEIIMLLGSTQTGMTKEDQNKQNARRKSGEIFSKISTEPGNFNERKWSTRSAKISVAETTKSNSQNSMVQ